MNAVAGGGSAFSSGLGYAAPAPAVALFAAGGDGDELCIEDPVEVSKPVQAGPVDSGPPRPPPPKPLGSSRGVLRRFFHFARRFWNQT